MASLFVLQYQKLTVCFYIDHAESAIAGLGFLVFLHGIWGVILRTYFYQTCSPPLSCTLHWKARWILFGTSAKTLWLCFCIAISKANRLLLYWSCGIGDSQCWFFLSSGRHMRSNNENSFYQTRHLACALRWRARWTLFSTSTKTLWLCFYIDCAGLSLRYSVCSQTTTTQYAKKPFCTTKNCWHSATQQRNNCIPLLHKHLARLRI